MRVAPDESEMTEEEISIFRALVGDEKKWNEAVQKMKKSRGGRYPSDWADRIIAMHRMGRRDPIVDHKRKEPILNDREEDDEE